MKTIITVYALLIVSICGADDIPMIDSSKEVIIRYSKESECGTGGAESAFYTFTYSLEGEGGEVLHKMRFLHNGGANDKPTTHDYYFEENGIVTKVSKEYDRKHRDSLTSGLTASGKELKKVTLKLGGKLDAEQRKMLQEFYSAMRSHRAMKRLGEK